MRLVIAAAILVCQGCQWGTLPPPEMPPPPLPPGPGDPPTCSEGVHVWENFHLGDDNLRPIVVNTSSFAPDLLAWNIEGSPIELRSSGSGFT